MTDQTISAYNRRAGKYEKKWEKYLAHTHEAFLRRIETADHDIVLDLSGGTGLLARMLIDRDYPFHKLIVNDPSKKMLSIARERLSGHPEIQFANDRASELPYQRESFNRIFCLNSFHFYPYQQQILDRCFTLLKPDGSFYILDWNRSGFFTSVNRLLAWVASDHINTRSLPELQDMLRESGFTLTASEEWRWRYWKFLFIEGRRS